MKLSHEWTEESVANACSKLRKGSLRSADLSRFPGHQCGVLKGGAASDSSFNGASFRGSWIEGCHFERCSFEAADLRGLRDHQNAFVDCEFSRTKFNGATIGFRGTRFERCSFDRADFGTTGFVRPTFSNCAFLNCNLKNIDFEASCFSGCRFIGTIEDVWFRAGYSVPLFARRFGAQEGCRGLDADFSGATLRGVGFANGLDLSQVRLAADGRHLLFRNWHEALARVADGANRYSAEDQTEIAIFVQAYSATRDQRHMIINTEDIRDMLGPRLSVGIIDLLEGIANRGQPH